MFNVRIEAGQALVIYGPQGSGKGQVARDLARQAGPYVEVQAHQLSTPVHSWLPNGTRACIVDGLPRAAEQLMRVKQLVSNADIEVQGRSVRSPLFIFCTDDAAAVKSAKESRRFHVVQLGAALH